MHLTFAIFVLVIFSTQVLSASVNISVEVDNEHIYPRVVTEPLWVTELLGPTEEPIATKRPNTLDRIRHTVNMGIQTVQNTISVIPSRINQIFMGISQNGLQSIIRRPGSPTVAPVAAASIPDASIPSLSSVISSNRIIVTANNASSIPNIPSASAAAHAHAWPQKLVVVKKTENII